VGRLRGCPPRPLHNMSTSALGTPAQVALAGARGSSTQVPRFDHAHKALAGTMALVNADETQANATVPNADTVLKTYTLAANTYSKIITEAEGYGTFGALSTNQAVEHQGQICWGSSRQYNRTGRGSRRGKQYSLPGKG